MPTQEDLALLAPSWMHRWCTYARHWVLYDPEGRTWNGKWCPQCQRDRELSRRPDGLPSGLRTGAHNMSRSFRQRSRRIGKELPDIAKAMNYAGRYWRTMIATYKLTKVQWLCMYHAQGGVCGLCPMPLTYPVKGSPTNIHVDHDHDTGVVRGMLCPSCNMMMAGVDNADWLTRALLWRQRGADDASNA